MLSPFRPGESIRKDEWLGYWPHLNLRLAPKSLSREKLCFFTSWMREFHWRQVSHPSTWVSQQKQSPSCPYSTHRLNSAHLPSPWGSTETLQVAGAVAGAFSHPRSQLQTVHIERKAAACFHPTLSRAKFKPKKNPVSSSRNQTEVSKEWTKECAGRGPCGRIIEVLVTFIHCRLLTRKAVGLTLLVSEGIQMGMIIKTTKASHWPNCFIRIISSILILIFWVVWITFLIL